jgi:uncharacterized protein YjiS (DUF1127 family)
MRTVGHVEGEISSLELHERTAGTARSPVVSGSFTERRGDSGSFLGLLAGIERPKQHTRSLQSQSVSDAARHPVAAALSWLAVCLVEGFAAYGQAVYPSFVDPSKIDDHQEPAPGSQSRSRAQGEQKSEAPWLTASYPRATPGGWIKRVKSEVAKVWSSMRFERRVRLTMTALARLDDRTLKDSGLHRSQIESVARHRDWRDYRY